MGKYNELIKKFDKIRDYMRDFYVYGFRSRNDFKNKSARTYDNEKRRIESYMGDHMKWTYGKNGKRSFITMDCQTIQANPLYSVWKAKSFTDNDINLHFYILSLLKTSPDLTVAQLTDEIFDQSGQIFDSQTVRNKCKEYVKEGLLSEKKVGKNLTYSLSEISYETLPDGFSEAIKFFQGASIFGEIGSFILDHEQLENDLFLFKHYYITHTLEDAVLLDILSAMKQGKQIEFLNENEAGTNTIEEVGLPLKIFVSVTTGRRYVCIYKLKTKRFFNYRLDHIKEVKIFDSQEDVDKLHQALEKNLPLVFGVSFGGESRKEQLSMKLFIDEKREQYIIDRIKREGRNGELIRLEENLFSYSVEAFDSNDISPWIKTFTGRIIQLEGTNDFVIKRFYRDLERMRKMYE